MLVVVVCEKFGWTYEEYMQQPRNFLDLIRHKLKIDSQVAANKKN